MISRPSVTTAGPGGDNAARRSSLSGASGGRTMHDVGALRSTNADVCATSCKIHSSRSSLQQSQAALLPRARREALTNALVLITALVVASTKASAFSTGAIAKLRSETCRIQPSPPVGALKPPRIARAARAARVSSPALAQIVSAAVENASAPPTAPVPAASAECVVRDGGHVVANARLHACHPMIRSSRE